MCKDPAGINGWREMEGNEKMRLAKGVYQGVGPPASSSDPSSRNRCFGLDLISIFLCVDLCLPKHDFRSPPSTTNDNDYIIKRTFFGISKTCHFHIFLIGDAAATLSEEFTARSGCSRTVVPSSLADTGTMEAGREIDTS